MTNSLIFKLERIESPIGTLLIVTDAQVRLRAMQWDADARRLEQRLQRHYGPACVLRSDDASPSHARQALEAYFGGDLHATESITVEAAGTPFQREVWAALRDIPVGKTMSYGGLAAKIGRPELVRYGARPMAANDPPCLIARTERLHGELGYRPIFDLPAAIDHAIAWWRGAGD